MKEKTNHSKEKRVNAKVSKWKTRFSAAQSNQQSLFDAAARWFDWFYASKDPGDIAPWRSKVSDPKVASKILGVIHKLSLYDPKPNFKPNDEHDYIKADNNERLIDWQTKNPRFDEPMSHKKFSVLVDAAVAGTGYAMIPWKNEKVKFRTRNRDDSGNIKYDEDKVKTSSIGYNEFNPISFFRVMVEPSAQSFYSSRWIIVVDFKTTEELEDLNDNADGQKFINLDKLKGNAGSDTANVNTYEASRNRLLNLEDKQSKDRTTKPNEIWYCFDLVSYKKLTIANGSTMIQEEEDCGYWHEKPPIAPFYIRPRAHSAFGDGLFERVEKLGAANDALINHYLDQLDLAINGLILRKETTVLDMEIAPGGEVVYTGDKPEQWKVPPPDSNGFQLARNVFNEAIEENTISNYELGLSRSNTDKTQGTKGGILAIQEAAGDTIAFFEKYFAESFKMVFTQWLSNNQQFLDHDQAVRVLGSEGYYPKTISAEDIITVASLDVEVDVDKMRPRNKDTDRALKLAWVDKQLEIVQVASKMGAQININWYELSRLLAENAGQIDFDRIVEPVPQANDSPTTENRLMLQGKELEPAMDEDHETHISIHKELLDDPGIDKDLLQNVIEPHIALHMTMFDEKKAQEAEAKEQAEAQANTERAGVVQETARLAQGVGNPVLAPGAGAPQPTGGLNVPPQASPAIQ